MNAARAQPQEEETRGLLKEIGAQLRKLRQKRGLTQAQLAEAAGLDFRNYQDVEGGKSNLRLSTLARLATFHAVPVASFFGTNVDDLMKMRLPPRLLTESFDGKFSWDQLDALADAWTKLDVAAALFDTDATYRLVNPKWTEQWGYKPEDVVGKKRVWELYEDDSRQYMQEMVRFITTLKPKPRTQLMPLRRRGDGAPANVKIDWDYVRDARGEVVAYVVLTWPV